MLCFFLAACEPPATPMPVVAPTTPTDNPANPIDSPPQAIQYALSAEMSAALPDLDLLSENIVVTRLSAPLSPADLDGRYDLIVTYGDQPGWTRSAVMPQVILIVNATQPPLDDPAIAPLIHSLIYPDEMVTALNIPGAEPTSINATPPAEVRAALANAGFPDGFDIRLAHAAPGAETLAEQLRNFSINSQLLPIPAAEIESAFATRQIHLALVQLMTDAERQTWVERVGADNIIDLYTIPISFWAADGLTITFTPDGFPLASR